MRILNIPNLLTLLRLLSLPFVIVLFRNGYHFIALGVFLAGMATDAVDGYLAKRLNQQTKLGLYLDPVVDKIVILSLFYELVWAGLLHPAVAHLFLARELLQNGVRAVLATQGNVVGANWMGKAKALLQTVLIGWGLALPAVGGFSAGDGLLTAFQVCATGLLCLVWGFFLVFVYWNRRRLA